MEDIKKAGDGNRSRERFLKPSKERSLDKSPVLPIPIPIPKSMEILSFFKTVMRLIYKSHRLIFTVTYVYK